MLIFLNVRSSSCSNTSFVGLAARKSRDQWESRPENPENYLENPEYPENPENLEYPENLGFMDPHGGLKVIFMCRKFQIFWVFRVFPIIVLGFPAFPGFPSI